MTTQDNAFTAKGTGTREDFLALATKQGGRRPTTGFQTREVDGNNFWIGGSFSGSIYGAQGISNKVGVYGQTGELTAEQVPQSIVAGVFGATKDMNSYSVVGWSSVGTGIKGWSPAGFTAIEGESVRGRGVWGYS